jgi:hypothetical protein
MQKKILISVENKQEYDDLIYLAKVANLFDYHHLILFTTHEIFSLVDYYNLSENKALYKSVYHSVNKFGQNFKTVSLLKKIILIIKNGLILGKVLRREKVDFILSGVPLIFHRVALLFSLRTLHVAYIRSLLFGALHGTSHSDSVSILLHKIPIVNKIRFFKNYYADLLLTVGNINKQILVRRNIPQENIRICGPIGIGCDNVSKMVTSADQKVNLIFVTAAYKWHRYKEGDVDQIHNLRKICDFIADKYADKFNLIIRVHPRDDSSHYAELRKKYDFISELNEAPLSEFLNYAGMGSVLISSLSTLAFEWMYLGGKAYIFSSPYLDQSLKPLFGLLDIKPYYDFEELLNHIQRQTSQFDMDKINSILYKPKNKTPVYLAAQIVQNYFSNR